MFFGKTPAAKKRLKAFAYGFGLTLVVLAGILVAEDKPDPIFKRAQELVDLQTKAFFVIPNGNALFGTNPAPYQRAVPFTDPDVVNLRNSLSAFRDQLDKASFERQNLKFTNQKLINLYAAIGAYRDIQKSFVTNAILLRHAGVSDLQFWQLDDLTPNLHVSDQVAVVLMSDPDAKIMYATRHIPDGAGGFSKVEIFLNPENIMECEFAALAGPRDRLGYARLVQYSMLRDNFINRWSLLRMYKEPFELGYKPVASCAQDLFSFYTPNQQALVASPYFQHLKDQDRYDDFLGAAEEMSKSLANQPLFGSQEYEAIVKEYFETFRSAKDPVFIKQLINNFTPEEKQAEYLAAVKIPDAVVDEMKTTYAPNIAINEENNISQKNNGKGSKGKGAEDMVPVAQQLFLEHNYPKDDLSPKAVAERMAAFAFEKRVKTVTDLLFTEIATTFVSSKSKHLPKGEDGYSPEVESKDAHRTALRIVTRHAAKIENAWKQRQKPAIESMVAKVYTPSYRLNRNTLRLTAYVKSITKGAQRGIEAMKVRDRVEDFIKYKMTSSYWGSGSTGGGWGGGTLSLTASGSNNPKSEWAYVGENPTRVSWKKAGIAKPLRVISPEEVSMLFMKKLENSEKYMKKGSGEFKAVERLVKSEVPMKYVRKFFARLSEKFMAETQAMRDQMEKDIKNGIKRDPVELTPETTPLRKFYAEVAKEVWKDFLIGISTPPVTGPVIIEKFDPNSFKSMLGRSDSLKLNSDNFGPKPRKISLGPKTDEEIVDYIPQVNKRVDAREIFESALGMLGVYQEATGQKIYFRWQEDGKPVPLQDQIKWYQSGVDIASRDFGPNQHPLDRLVASIYDQLSLADVKINIVYSMSPIFAAETKDSDDDNSAPSLLRELANTYASSSDVSSEGLQPRILSFTIQALNRDKSGFGGRTGSGFKGKVETYCDANIRSPKDDIPFRRMWLAASGTRKVLLNQYPGMKGYDKELTGLARSEWQRFLEDIFDPVGRFILKAMIVAGICFLGYLALVYVGAVSVTAAGATGAASAAGATAAGGAATVTGVAGVEVVAAPLVTAIKAMTWRTFLSGLIKWNLTSPLGLLNAAFMSTTLMMVNVNLYVKPKDNFFLSEAANSQFGIMGLPSTDRDDLRERRAELHAGKIMTWVAVGMDATLFVGQSVYTYYRALGFRGTQAVMRLTEGNPELRKQLMQRSLRSLINDYGMKEGFSIYSQRYLKAIKSFGRVNGLGESATKEALELSLSHGLAREVPERTVVESVLEAEIATNSAKITDLGVAYAKAVQYATPEETMALVDSLKQWLKDVSVQYGAKSPKSTWRVVVAESAEDAIKTGKLHPSIHPIAVIRSAMILAEKNSLQYQNRLLLKTLLDFRKGIADGLREIKSGTEFVTEGGVRTNPVGYMAGHGPEDSLNGFIALDMEQKMALKQVFRHNQALLRNYGRVKKVYKDFAYLSDDLKKLGPLPSATRNWVAAPNYAVDDYIMVVTEDAEFKIIKPAQLPAPKNGGAFTDHYNTYTLGPDALGTGGL